jgi:hypothetical protein
MKRVESASCYLLSDALIITKTKKDKDKEKELLFKIMLLDGLQYSIDGRERLCL